MGHDWAQCAGARRRGRPTGGQEEREASPGSDVLARAPNGTRTASLMSERKEIEEEEEACWDLGHSSVRLSLRGRQKLNQASVQAASLIHPP